MNKIYQGQKPSKEDLFYIEWGRESVKNNIDNANTVLSKLLTLNTALIAGGAFFGSAKLSEGIPSLAPILFFIGLALAFIGIMPHESNINTISPSSIKYHKDCALLKKRLFMWTCAVSTGAGLFILICSIYWVQ